MNTAEDARAATAQAVVTAAKAMYAKGLVEGTAGNVSGRAGDGTFCLTPSSLAYEAMTQSDLIFVGADGTVVAGDGHPSSEKSLHLACYARWPEVGGVLHCHPLYASMFAVARQPVPAAIEEVVVYIGGDVEVCDYHLTGSDELGAAVAAALGDRSAVLMANHGLVTVGKDPADALRAALVVERTAHIVWGARLLGTPGAVPEQVNEDFAGVYRWVRADLWTDGS
ncbi:MAG: class II aldolase/adducin family protein [bacterium]|nr:class II aldolase/adducin family protein [bacterium]